MECTQKLECTQNLYESQYGRTCPEQIGFLGICGTKYPVIRGPNKIGRDPQTCNIVLNLNSVSRQHAVINILSNREFMLMDLDSANKTKLIDKILQPYIPHPLKNGDTLQFGQVFGVFRLLEEETDLPMTQAIDIPETPVFAKHISRINNAPITMVPESPDVSDKEDSFIVASQTKSEKHSNNNFIKPSGKPFAIQPVGSKKIDNIYWTSTKKSTSLSLKLDDSNNSFNELTTPPKRHPNDTNDNNLSIHEMDTQDHFAKKQNMSRDSIYTMETQAPLKEDYLSIHELSTQVPNLDGLDFEKIHNIDTQLPDGVETLVKHDKKPVSSPSIYSLETQLPSPEKENSTQLDENSPTDLNDSQLINNLETQDACLFNTHLPKTGSIDNLLGQELCVNIIPSIKDDSIFEAETQIESINQEPVLSNDIHSPTENNDCPQEGVAFDEMNTQSFHIALDSKPETKIEDNGNDPGSNENTQEIKPLRRSVRIESDESTDCEDICIMPTQKIESKMPDDDLTDCEDDIFEFQFNTVDECKKSKGNISNTIVFQDQPTQVLKEDASDDDFQDVLTQVIDEDFEKITEKEPSFEDLLTQKLDDPNDKNRSEDLPVQAIQQLPENVNANEDKQNTGNKFDSPFKVPLVSPLRAKRTSKNNLTQKQDEAHKQEQHQSFQEDNDRYYNDTQEIFDDLCSQKNLSSEIRENSINIEGKLDVDAAASSVDDFAVNERCPRLDKVSSPRKKYNSSFEQSDEEKTVSRLSKEQVKNIIGSETQVATILKTLSDPSDVEVTPKKLKPFRLMEIDLPNSQEIKTSVSFNCRSSVTGSSSESEVEQNDSEECTPILFKKKTKTPKTNAMIDLTKRFDIEALPSRVSTRTRKPTAKLQNGEGDALKVSKSILKSKYINEQEENIDNEIIIENITRLRNKSKYSKKDNKSLELKNERKESHDMKDDIDGDTKVVVESAAKKSEPKRRGRPPKLKKSSQDAIVSEIIKAINQRGSNTKNGTDGNNQTLPQVKALASSKSLNTTSDRPKRSSGRRKSDSQKEDTGGIDQKRQSDPNKDDKLSKNKKESKKEVVSRKRNKEGQVKQESIKPERPKRATKKLVSDEICDLSSSEKESETRRSKRQRKKENSKNEDSKPQNDQDEGRKFEQSTVYCISSESSNDSPKNLKRLFIGEVEQPNAKRTRLNAGLNSSLRATPARAVKKHFVLFTAFPCEEVRLKLEKLGAIIVTDVTKCTVVLTLQIKRTFKLLCAVGLGIPIVGPNWVQACYDTNIIVDPWLYLIKDNETEKRFSFNLERTLTGKRSFLSGYNISSTPSVVPGSAEMKLIVECSGGVWKAERPQWLCVSCPADRAQWPALRRKGAIVVSPELILGGVLSQKMEIEKNTFK